MTGRVITKNNQPKDYFKNSTQNDIYNNALDTSLSSLFVGNSETTGRMWR